MTFENGIERIRVIHDPKEAAFSAVVNAENWVATLGVYATVAECAGPLDPQIEQARLKADRTLIIARDRLNASLGFAEY